MMFGPSPREHVIVEHVDDDGGQPSVFLGHDPLAAMNGGVTIRERVDRPVHLDAGAEPLGHALVLEPLDSSLDEIPKQVSQPQFVIVAGQQEVNEIVHPGARSI